MAFGDGTRAGALAVYAVEAVDDRGDNATRWSAPRYDATPADELSVVKLVELTGVRRGGAGAGGSVDDGLAD